MSADKNWKTVTFTILGVLLGLMFLFSGGTKVAGMQMHVESFANFGLPDWTRPVVGLTEVVAGLLLLLPKTRFWGALILIPTMIGAALTHIVSGVEVGSVGVNVVVGGLATWMALSLRAATTRSLS